MDPINVNVVVAGAGIAGLVACLELEKKGVSPLLIDTLSAVGGRLQTDFTSQGIPLDHGFQVLLSAYPEVKRYLDLDSLDVIRFSPGAIIHHGSKQSLWGDPMRDSSFFWSTLRSPVGTLADKVRMYGLQRALQKRSIPSLFEEEEKSTLSYLKSFGFSDRIIDRFFRPFFSGIFLETNLQSSHRMFLFIFKMFSEGYALWPKNGIHAIATQLFRRLERTQFLSQRSISSCTNSTINLSDGQTLSFDHLIWANASDITGLPSKKKGVWHSCVTSYFAVPKQDQQLILHLVADDNRLVNHFHFLPSSVVSAADDSVLSASVINTKGYEGENLLSRIQNEMKELTGIKEMSHLRSFSIDHALPDGTHTRYEPEEKDMRLAPTIICAGDHVANPSLQAAMLSGRKAAELTWIDISAPRS